MTSIDYFAWRNVVGARQPIDQQHILWGFYGWEGAGPAQHAVPWWGARASEWEKQALHERAQPAANWLESVLTRGWTAVRVNTEGTARRQRKLDIVDPKLMQANYGITEYAWVEWQDPLWRGNVPDRLHEQKQQMAEFYDTIWMWTPQRDLAMLYKLSN